jgi:FolB domain-containing protein
LPFPNLSNREGRPFDQVQLTGILMSCVIGIFPSERSRKQPVTIDMSLYLDTRRAAQSTNIHDTIDYAGAVKEVLFILDHCEFLLIETAVEAVCRHFLTTYQADHSLPTVEAVMIRISKPSALTHGIVPAVQIMRRKGDYLETPVKTLAQDVYTIHQAHDVALHLVASQNDAPVEVQSLVADAQSILPIGRWSLNGQPIKPRIPVMVTPGLQQVFASISGGAKPSGTSRLLLVQSRPIS